MKACSAAPVRAARDVPVLPDPDQARRWASDELAKSPYQQAKPGWLQQLWQGFLDWLRGSLDSLNAINPNLGAVIVVVVVVVVVALAAWLIRPRLNPRRRPPADVFADGVEQSAAEHRRLAAEAAAACDWAAGVVEQFRALVRTAEERDVIPAQPGRTADEVTLELRRSFPRFDAALLRGASTFNRVRYGRRAAASTDYDELLALEQALARERPDYRDTPAAGLVIPR